jgi:hypothetical protein
MSWRGVQPSLSSECGALRQPVIECTASVASTKSSGYQQYSQTCRIFPWVWQEEWGKITQGERYQFCLYAFGQGLWGKITPPGKIMQGKDATSLTVIRYAGDPPVSSTLSEVLSTARCRGVSPSLCHTPHRIETLSGMWCSRTFSLSRAKPDVPGAQAGSQQILRPHP